MVFSPSPVERGKELVMATLVPLDPSLSLRMTIHSPSPFGERMSVRTGEGEGSGGQGGFKELQTCLTPIRLRGGGEGL